ncbi:MAG: class I SAM-dependent methyltransferase [Nitrospina sp.]|jgi:ubiquinone/menaquinone biosynthesis C-methylase UbiE/uncharacterized protein YbaR (Trm112 family)|nr:class I SAM-dependent methyltransferase [Nitrospina sp.]MBT5631432.1 class I SAM-dependent methyltransferase [Nitrospina sp.]
MNKSVDAISTLNGPLCCPLTRSNLQLIDDHEEISALNRALNDGDLTLAAGKIPGGKIGGVLISSEGQHRYPVIDGVPCLFDDFRIVKQTENSSTKEVSLQMNDLQREQWELFSARYERWTGGPGGIITKVQEEFQRRNFEVLSNGMKGAVVLDVGNGGATAIEQLGPEVSNSLKAFYALDSSYPMLTRNNKNGNQILGDAKKLPFSDQSIDYVIVNNPLHHFGRHKDTDPAKMMKEFFKEVFRVSCNGVIGVEMVIPHIALHVETLVLNYLEFMPTFVYSERFYSCLVADLGVEVIDFKSIPQRNLISPLKFGPPIMDLPFIQLPAFLTPYSFLFYHLKPKLSH